MAINKLVTARGGFKLTNDISLVVEGPLTGPVAKKLAVQNQNGM